MPVVHAVLTVIFETTPPCWYFLHMAAPTFLVKFCCLSYVVALLFVVVCRRVFWSRKGA